MDFLDSMEALRELDSIQVAEKALFSEEIRLRHARERIEFQLKTGLIRPIKLEDAEIVNASHEFQLEEGREIEAVLDFYSVPKTKAIRDKASRKMRKLLADDNCDLSGTRINKSTDHPSTDPNDKNVYWLIETKSAVDFLPSWEKIFAKLFKVG